MSSGTHHEVSLGSSADEDAQQQSVSDGNVYLYIRVDKNDDLSQLLAAAQHRKVNDAIMRRKVQHTMEKRLDTGIRVNKQLAAAHKIPIVDTDEVSDDVFAEKYDFFTLYPLSPEVCEESGLALVGVTFGDRPSK